MKISANQRTINILNKAIALGFDFEENQSIENIRTEAEDYLIDNCDVIDEIIEVHSYNHGQYISYSDSKGYEYWQSGEILHFSENWHESPDTKISITKIVDSEANVINLCYLVGETDYNAPDGYCFSRKENKHVKIEENE